MNKHVIIFSIISAVIVLILFVYASSVEAETPIEEAQAETTTKETECVILECTTMYNVPLSDELQLFIREQCRENGIDARLVLAIISVESSFRTSAYNADTDCYGLMQINGVNLPLLRKNLGITNLFDAYENVLGGVYLLSKASVGYDTEHALMIYNCGLTGAKRLWDSGIHSTDYTQKVLAAKEKLKVRERIYEEV